MAPVLNVIIQLLPSWPIVPKAIGHTKATPNHQLSLPRVDDWQPQSLTPKHTQYPIDLKLHDNGKDHAMGVSKSDISAISWSENRLDVFALAENNLTHKYWDGYQWNPAGVDVELLGNGLATPPVAVTWGVDRLDIFGLDDHSTIKHQYWDGTAWRPSPGELENLGGGCDSAHAIAPNTWGKDRLDIFCTGPEGDLLHQYWDGSQWNPEPGALESLGGSLSSGPSVVSWGEGRLDIFGVGKTGDAAHKYWDGSQWSEWETFPLEREGLPKLRLRPNLPVVATTWGKDRLDIYAFSDAPNALLYHKFWDGFQWSKWEFLGIVPSLESFAATSWSENRHDIIVNGAGHLYHKYWDGTAWKPDPLGWEEKSPENTFVSTPAVVSWGENRLDIFAVNDAHELQHQAWVGVAWFPSNTGWETLGTFD
ncbi:MAG: hypothetical protein Q9182_006709 [Xanthomendoza sp. 2 TL-2023]